MSEARVGQVENLPREYGHFQAALVLNVSYAGGKNRQISLRPEQRELVEQWLKNYHDLKGRLEEIRELNQVLLRPEP
jgi:hypothetical protein